MAVESAADRAAFLSTDDFGVEVTWTRASVPSTFDAVFSRAAVMVDGPEVALIDRDAWLICREADLPSGAVAGDPVAIADESATFLCQAIRPTGDGMARVDLKRAS